MFANTCWGLFGTALTLAFGMISLPAGLEWLQTWCMWGAILSLAASLVCFFSYPVRSRRNDDPAKLRPDIGAAKGWTTLLYKSKRAKQLARRHRELLNVPAGNETGLSQTAIIEDRLKRRLKEELHEALRQGRVVAWGTPRDGSPEHQIEASEWSHVELLLNDDELKSRPYFGGEPQIAAWERETSDRRSLRGYATCYLNVQFSRRNFYREFPLGWRARKISADHL
jgi:hypothetical protein